MTLVLGLLLGVGLAFLVDYLDDTIKTKTDLERISPTLPVLGLIPAVTGWKRKEETYLVSAGEPTSPPAEAYRTLRTAIQFNSWDTIDWMAAPTSA